MNSAGAPRVLPLPAGRVEQERGLRAVLFAVGRPPRALGLGSFPHGE